MPEVSYKDKPERVDLSVVLPAYDEEEAIGEVIGEIRQALADWPGVWEILVVNDASMDRTEERAEAEGVRVIRRVENGGSGAACKSGIVAARGELVALMDADGTYVPAHLPNLLSFFPDYDQVNGARTNEAGTYKLLRVPVKWLIRKCAEWISGKQIPDLNTGMRVFKRELMIRYLWTIPDGFSWSTSMTLAFLCNGHPVKYVPVPYRRRTGASKFRPVRDTANYLLRVVRVLMYFQPLRIFLPLSMVLGGIALAKGSYNTFRSPTGLQDSDIMLAITALLMLVLGLLADLIVAQRR